MGSFLSNVGSTLQGIGSGVVSGMTGGLIPNAFGKPSGTSLGTDPKVKSPKTGITSFTATNPWHDVGMLLGTMVGSNTDVGKTMSTFQSSKAQSLFGTKDRTSLYALAEELSKAKPKKKRLKPPKKDEGFYW